MISPFGRDCDLGWDDLERKNLLYFIQKSYLRKPLAVCKTSSLKAHEHRRKSPWSSLLRKMLGISPLNRQGPQ